MYLFLLITEQVNVDYNGNLHFPHTPQNYQPDSLENNDVGMYLW